MNKSGILITSALLSLGLAASAMAGDPPMSTAPAAADTPAAGAPAPASKTTKHKKHKKATPAPATTK